MNTYRIALFHCFDTIPGMARSSTKLSDFEKLKKVEAEAQSLRTRLKFSKAGEVLYSAVKDPFSDREIVVEADGLGGATLLVIEGNYPIDYLVLKEQHFTNEDAACDAADDMVQ